jgi:4-methylaminobutanoate oxidase (formaldehyde-forming)
VVNCGGIYAAEIGRLAGVRIPIVPMSHQYVITEGFRTPGSDPLPTLRDPDLLVYYRQDVDGLLMGGYERRAAPWTTSATSFDAIPADFNGRLLPEDWSRLEEIAQNSQLRVPAMKDLGVRRFINGPESFTPDNEFCLGETEVAGLFVAAGFCAHGIAGAGGIGRVMAEWILTGDPGEDLWHMDISRFGRQYRSPAYTLARTLENYQTYYDIRFPGDERTSARPLRVSPAYGWHRDHGAVFGEKSGWERVNYYAGNEDPALDGLRPAGWAGRNWSSAVAVEHRATRDTVGLFDESSFAKIAVRGPGAPAFLEWVCDNRVARKVGAVTYTQALNRTGGIESDFTVTRTGGDEFLIVTGTAFGSHDLAWLAKQARLAGADDLTITDVTGQYACYALWGPRAREVLSALTPNDVSNEAFPYMTSQEIAVGLVPVRATRVTYAGELGWELYATAEYGATLWQQLVDAGRDCGLVPGGYRAIDSLRVEKAYRVWGSDITPETNPYEAGLGFCVKLDKPGGFLGRDALAVARDAGLSRSLACLVLDDPRRVVLGGEPMRIGGEVCGRVTSGGYGYTLEASIAYGYLPMERAEPGVRVEIDLFGESFGASIVAQPMFDPAATRVRA